MAQIELTQVEIDFLLEILQKYLSELSMEIAGADKRDLREFLKKRQNFMEDFIQRLERELIPGGRESIQKERLRHVDILQGLTDPELESIAPFCREENLPSGATLCEEGATAERLYILEQGEVSLSSQKGGRFKISTPGKVVGWSFLVPPFRYTASAVNTTPSRFLVIKNPDFHYLLHKEGKMGMKLMNNLAQVIASRLRGV